jgi:hypothetical protein
LAKDTVARALVRLRRAGLVTATQTRSVSGVFTTGSYQLSVPGSITFDDTFATAPISERSSLRSRSSRSAGSQLALAIDS